MFRRWRVSADIERVFANVAHVYVDPILGTAKSGVFLSIFLILLFLIRFQKSFDRRFRFYEISDFGETIKTYKRTEQDEIVDEMVLAGKGAPPPYEGS